MENIFVNLHVLGLQTGGERGVIFARKSSKFGGLETRLLG